MRTYHDQVDEGLFESELEIGVVTCPSDALYAIGDLHGDWDITRQAHQQPHPPLTHAHRTATVVLRASPARAAAKARAVALLPDDAHVAPLDPFDRRDLMDELEDTIKTHVERIV